MEGLTTTEMETVMEEFRVKKTRTKSAVTLDNKKKKAQYESLNKQMREIAAKGQMIHIPAEW